jgi:ABC-type cobalamin/Fe3+-siderophores transport system ATPase subunit
VTTAFEARRLSYAYPGGPPVVREVSLEVPPASMTAVIGANGSGKSTLIRMLAGLFRPASGEILLDGIRLDRWEPRLRAREIAYVPQATAAAFPFRVIEVVLSGRTPHIPRFRLESARDREIALEALASTGAAHLAARPVTGLSAGEKQMVMLARALAQQPRLLLLDEPSSALDLKHRAGLMRTLARLRETRALSIVMITHDLQLTGSLFDRILALRDGETAALGSPDEVLRSELLSEIYDEPNVRARRMGGQTLVWIEA